MTPEGTKLINVIILGCGFLLVFSAFQTGGNIEQTVIKSINSTRFHGSGYTSLAIIYTVFSASNILTPSIVAVLGARLSMVISGLVYSVYSAVFIEPFTWSFYLASVIIGMAAAVIWTAQGNCLTTNSDENTIGRNSGIFWALLQFSLLFGNLYIYLAWKGETHISDHNRRTVYIALTVISGVGSILFLLIRQPVSEVSTAEQNKSDDESDAVLEPQEQRSQAIDAIRSAICIFFTKDMLLLSITITYTGIELTFFSGVYGTCLGATNGFGNEAKSLIGLSGTFIGVGEIVGGATFGLLNKFLRKYLGIGRNPVVLLGLLCHIIAFYLIFLNVPGDSPIVSDEGTDRVSYLIPSKIIAMVCSFLLGLGDSCFNTQLLSIVGYMYSEESAPAFAVFKFVQSISAAIAFGYSNYLLLKWQLLILGVVGLFGTISFILVEWKTEAHSRGFSYNRI
ncbi:UNC93-like protein MFSD11 [Chiloscyllium plagiosum]|uniref:UNC93-like protein MFSD11 n=1 Tax=Chiloscyllium plagiosum TaxID=36176 RepID=UPI001CB7E620|nr:UNC93-like protein MFSD11 [Chiloscyllium plagiosum]XP_043570586.1 UNC93-like protein MFSD11 [Chiloscyllium plagiosum]